MKLVDLRLEQLPELLAAVVQAMHDLAFYGMNKTEIPKYFTEDIHEYFRNRFLCFKHAPGLVLKIRPVSTKKGTSGEDLSRGNIQ